MTMTNDVSVLSFLEDQHEAIKSMMRDIRAADANDRASLFEEFKWYLAMHEAFEIEVVHPVIEKIGADGAGEAAQSLSEEHAASNTLSRLESLDPASEDFERDFAVFQQAVVNHAEHEEHEEFPALTNVDEATDATRIAVGLGRALELQNDAAHSHNGAATAERTFAQLLDETRSEYRNAFANEGTASHA